MYQVPFQSRTLLLLTNFYTSQRITLQTSPQEDFGVDPERIAKWLAPRAGGVCSQLAIPKKPFTENGHLAKFLEATLPHISTSLTSLSIAAKITCSDIAYVVQHAKHLTHLELSCLEADLDKRKLRQLSGLRDLIHVVIRVEDTLSLITNRSHGRRNECPILGSLTGLPKLKTVSIAYSSHADDNSYLLPQTIGRLTSLEKLSLENSLVLRLPEEFTLLKKVKELNFTWSRCCDFLASQKTWDSFGRLPNLECLTLHRCCIERWPTINKHHLARLTRLVLTGSIVSWLGPEGFPQGFFPHLPNLQELVLRSSALPALPNDIFTLEKLKFLDVSDNYLVDMPQWEIYLPKLKSLKTLNAGNNSFPALPRRFILGCPSLEYIFMEHCENLEMSASINWLVDGSSLNTEIERKVIDIHKQSHRFQESSKRWINELQTKVRDTALKLYYGDLTEYEEVQGKNECGCTTKVNRLSFI
jgi:hypothetical protein